MADKSKIVTPFKNAICKSTGGGKSVSKTSPKKSMSK